MRRETDEHTLRGDQDVAAIGKASVQFQDNGESLLERPDSKEAIDRILNGSDKALAETVRTMARAARRDGV